MAASAPGRVVTAAAGRPYKRFALPAETDALIDALAMRLKLPRSEVVTRAVAELAASEPDQHTDSCRLMRRVELAPRALCSTKLRQCRPWIAFRQLDGTGRLSGESV